MKNNAGVQVVEEAILRMLRQSKEALSPREINDRLREGKLEITLASVVAILQEMREDNKIEVEVGPLAQGGTRYRAKNI